MTRRFAGLLVAVVVTLGWTTSASAQVVIQGEGQAGGVYGQGTVYVQPAPQQQPQQQVIVQSPYVAQQQPQPQPVRTIIHSAPTTALLVPGVIALGGGWLLHGIISLGVAQNCEASFSRDVSCPYPVGDWAGLGWIPIAGPWLAYGLIDHLGEYAWMNILFGIVQGAGVILTVLGIAIQDEWEEAVYADLGNGVSLTMTAGPTSVGADLRF